MCSTRKSNFIGILFVIFAVHSVSSFFTPVNNLQHRSPSSLSISWWDQDEESRNFAANHNNLLRTDIRNFLTQRSLQSFIHLCLSCRDPHTVQWMESFGGWRNLEEYHGTGGLNTTLFPIWSSMLIEMLDRPQDTVIVNITRGQGNSGNKNPYLEEQVFQFEIDINPASLANRILSVREQIADEWVSDLESLKTSNEMVLQSYHEKIKNNATSTTTAGNSTASDNNAAAFERRGITYFVNDNAFGDKRGSPLRHRSFDLLTLLSTQESIHRVLRQYVDAGNEREVSFKWLRTYYTERLARYFDGNQELGCADDFFEELLLTPPSIQTEGREMNLIDPLRIAEDIITTRSEVAMDWKEIISEVKEVDHTDIRKIILEKQMLKWGSSTYGFHTKTESASAENKVAVSSNPNPVFPTATENKSSDGTTTMMNSTGATTLICEEIMGEFQ